MTFASQFQNIKKVINDYGNAAPAKFVATNSSLSNFPTAFMYDHGPNAYAAAPVTGSSPKLAIPGLLPVLAQDDGALTGVATVTYPAAAAIGGTGDFTIVGLANLSPSTAADSYIYKDSTSLALELISSSDTVTGTINNVPVCSSGSNAGIVDGRTHLYAFVRQSGVTYLYMDGALIDSDSSSFSSPSITAGTPSTTINVANVVTIDEVAWWNVALTASQILALTSAAGLITSASGLTAGQWLTANITYFAFSDFNLDPGSSLIDTPDVSTGDAAGVLNALAHAEDGMCFVDGSGRLRFRGRNNIGSSLATIGDGGGAEIPFVATPAWSMDIDRIANRVQVTKDGKASVLEENTDSENRYGVHSMQWAAGILNTAQMADAGLWLLGRYKEPDLRLDSLVVRGGPGGYWPSLLGLELGDRVTVNHRPPGGTLLTDEVFIEQIEHQIAPDDWVITFQLAAVPDVWILGDSVFSVLDTTTVAGW